MRVMYLRLIYGILVLGMTFAFQRNAVRLVAGLGSMNDSQEVFSELSILTIPCAHFKVLDVLVYDTP